MTTEVAMTLNENDRKTGRNLQRSGHEHLECGETAVRRGCMIGSQN